MQVVKVTISNPAPEVEENATIILEGKRGDNWNREDSKDVAVGKSESTSTFQLRRDQRLVIEARTEQDVKLSPTQFSAFDTKRQESATDVDAPKERAEGSHLKQAEERMMRDAKLNTAPGAEPPKPPQTMQAPPNPDETKKDDTSKSVGARTSTGVKENRP